MVIEITGKITNVYQKCLTYYDMLMFDGISSAIRSRLHVDLINEDGKNIDQNDFATGLNGEWSGMRVTGHLHKISHQNLTLVLKTQDQIQTLDKFIFSWSGFAEDKSNLTSEPTSHSTITQINITPKQGYAGDSIVFEALVSEPDTAVHLDIFDEHGARKINTGQVVFDKPFKHVLTLSKSTFKPGTLRAEFYTDDSNKKKIGSFRFLGSQSKSKNELVSNNLSVIQTNQKRESKPESLSNNKQWDVFISHASEDKEAVAKPFSEKLQNLGLKVWFDEFSLKWGKSLRKSIDEGLSNSLFGIVILSDVFFQKSWTQFELDGLISIMNSSRKDNILPLRYGISHEQVANVSPLLAGIFSRSWDEGVDKLAKEVKELVDETKK